MTPAGALRDRVAFDEKVRASDGYGGHDAEWSEVYACAAEFRYQRGQEAIDAGAVTGTATFKVRVRSCTATRALTTDHRMRDVRRELVFNIRECDAITDRDWVWLVAEAGRAPTEDE